MTDAYTPSYMRLNAIQSEEDRAGRAVLDYAFTRLTSMINSGAASVTNSSGSTLEGDDALTAYNPVSYQLAYFALVSVDHLRFLRDAVLARDEFAVMAEYSAIRSALEASAYGIWLASGGTRSKRVRNSLRLSWDGATDASALMRATGDDRDTLGDIRKRLRTIQLEGPARQDSIEGMPSTTEVLIQTDKRVPTGTVSGLEAWRICSGIAHSNPQVALALLDHTWADKDGGLSRIANRVGLLAALFEIAVTYLEHLLAIWGELASAPPTQLKH
jgi:hypothetical protein